MHVRGIGKLSSKAASRGIERANWLLALMAGTMVFILTWVILYDVTLRYVLRKAASWPIDVGELLMLAIVYLPMPLLSQEREHVSIDVVVNRLSASKRVIARLFANLLSLVFGILLAWRGVVILEHAYTEGSITMSAFLPVWPAVVFLVVGCIFLAVQQFINLVTDARSALTKSL